MKNGRIAVIIGSILLVAQLVSMLSLWGHGDSPWDVAQEVHAMGEDQVTLGQKLCYGFYAGHERNAGAIRSLFVKEYLDDTVSSGIRYCLAEGKPYTPLLALYDLCVLVGYCLNGLVGLVLVVSGWRRKKCPVETSLCFDGKATIKSWLTWIVACLVLLSQLENLHSCAKIYAQPWGGTVVQWIVSWVTYPGQLWEVVLLAFLIVRCQKTRNVLFPAALMLLGMHNLVCGIRNLGSISVEGLARYNELGEIESWLDMASGVGFALTGWLLHENRLPRGVKVLTIGSAVLYLGRYLTETFFSGVWRSFDTLSAAVYTAVILITVFSARNAWSLTDSLVPDSLEDFVPPEGEKPATRHTSQKQK